MVSSPETTQCTYVKRTGKRCPNQGYNGRCHSHKRSTSHTLCRHGCGRGTLSVTKYCNKCEPCQSGMQGFILQRMRREAKQAQGDLDGAKTKRERLEAEWDAYIDECMKSADMVLDLTNSAPPSGACRCAAHATAILSSTM